MKGNLKNIDEYILSLLIDNETRAIDILYDEYYEKIVRVAFRVLGDNSSAKDIVQELLLNIWLKRHSLTITKPLAAYLSRSVVNRCLNHLRDNRQNKYIPIKWIQNHTVQSDHLESLESKDLEYLARKVIETLPPKCRLIFTLSRSEEMSHREIANCLDISQKAVEKQITKALKRFRVYLKPYLSTLLYFLLI